MPESSISWVCASRERRSTGSSSMSRCSAAEILSSSPRVLGSMAKVVAGSGKTTGGYTMGCALSHSVSPVWVSFSLATAPRSPAWISGTGVWVLPSSSSRWPSALGDVAGRVVDRGVGLERPGVDAEEADAAGVRVGHGLEDEGGEGRVGDGLARDLVLRVTGSVPATSPRSTGRRQQVDDRVQEGVHPDVAHRRGGEHGEDPAREHAPGAGRARGRPAAACPSRRTPPSGLRCSPPPSRRASRARRRRRPRPPAGRSTVWNLPLWSSA